MDADGLMDRLLNAPALEQSAFPAGGQGPGAGLTRRRGRGTRSRRLDAVSHRAGTRDLTPSREPVAMTNDTWIVAVRRIDGPRQCQQRRLTRS